MRFFRRGEEKRCVAGGGGPGRLGDLVCGCPWGMPMGVLCKLALVRGKSLLASTVEPGRADVPHGEIDDIPFVGRYRLQARDRARVANRGDADDPVVGEADLLADHERDRVGREVGIGGGRRAEAAAGRVRRRAMFRSTSTPPRSVSAHRPSVAVRIATTLACTCVSATTFGGPGIRAGTSEDVVPISLSGTALAP